MQESPAGTGGQGVWIVLHAIPLWWLLGLPVTTEVGFQRLSVMKVTEFAPIASALPGPQEKLTTAD